MGLTKFLTHARASEHAHTQTHTHTQTHKAEIHFQPVHVSMFQPPAPGGSSIFHSYDITNITQKQMYVIKKHSSWGVYTS
jgi:hypothetical protein